ncbi:hypothetical protein, partial [Nocardia sp. 852002-51244_SCH5132740]|uniref:hypothetical protein n=1 Tax=Nocardia sp. 852002-51244_SCH5132740 TaxID=1834099 RepID=UPI001E4229BD
MHQFYRKTVHSNRFDAYATTEIDAYASTPADSAALMHARQNPVDASATTTSLTHMHQTRPARTFLLWSSIETGTHTT